MGLSHFPTASYWVVLFEVMSWCLRNDHSLAPKRDWFLICKKLKLCKVHGKSHDISNLNRTRGNGRSMEVYKQKTGHGRNGVRWKDKVTMTLSPSHILNECIWDQERNRSKFGTSSPIVSYKTIYIHSWAAFHSSFLCDGEQGTAQTCSNGCRSAWDLDYLDLRYLNPGMRLQYVV